MSLRGVSIAPRWLAKKGGGAYAFGKGGGPKKMPKKKIPRDSDPLYYPNPSEQNFELGFLKKVSRQKFPYKPAKKSAAITFPMRARPRNTGSVVLYSQ